MARAPSGPLGNAPRDERDDFVGAPAEKITAGAPLRWPPQPKKITKDTFHAKVQGRTSQQRADRSPTFRKGGWVSGYASGGEVKHKDGGSSDKWMQGAVKHPGALHRALGVPQGQKIPAAKIAKAAHSDNPSLKRKAVLAQTFAKHRP